MSVNAIRESNEQGHSENRVMSAIREFSGQRRTALIKVSAIRNKVEARCASPVDEGAVCSGA